MAKIQGSNGLWYQGEVKDGRIWTAGGNTGVAPMGSTVQKKVLAPWATEADKAYAAAHPERYEVPGAAQSGAAAVPAAATPPTQSEEQRFRSGALGAQYGAPAVPTAATSPSVPEPLALSRPAILQLEYQPAPPMLVGPAGGTVEAKTKTAPTPQLAGWLSRALGEMPEILLPGQQEAFEPGKGPLIGERPRPEQPRRPQAGASPAATQEPARRFQTGALGEQFGSVEATGRLSATELQGLRYQLMAEQAYTGRISPYQLNVIAGVPERGGLTRGQLADAARLSAQAISYGKWPNKMSPQVASFMGLPLDLWAQLYGTDYPYSLLIPDAPGGTPGAGGGRGRRSTSGGRGGRAATPSSPYLGLTFWRI